MKQRHLAGQAQNVVQTITPPSHPETEENITQTILDIQIESFYLK